MSPTRSFDLSASVIIATRNRADYLTECLRTLADQDCEEQFEIIVIDNDSTDETPKVIEEWMRKSPKIRTFRETRLGLSAAKNAGARLARGRLLLFTDDDVLVESTWVRRYLDWFGRVDDSNAMVGGPIVPILNDLRAWPNWFDELALGELGLLHYGAERQPYWQCRRQELEWGLPGKSYKAERYRRFWVHPTALGSLAHEHKRL